MNSIHKKNNTLIPVFFALGIFALVVLNLISQKVFYRFDLTENKEYTLSKTTEKFVGDLNDLLIVKVYFTKSLPPDLINLSNYVHDILAEYASISDRVRVEYIDPAGDEAAAAEAESLGIPQVQMNVYSKDQFEVKNGYLGIAFYYGGRTEVIPVVSQADNLEYQFSSAIRKVASSEVKKIGFITGHNELLLYEPVIPEANADGTVIAARTALERLYEVKSVNLQSGLPITDLDTLVVHGSKSGLSDRELYEIDQFVMNGGNVVFLLNPAFLTLGIQTVMVDTRTDAILEKYGLRLNKNLVLDESNELVSFSVGGRSFLSAYPFWVKTMKENYSQSPIFSALESLVFPWAGSVETMALNGIVSEILIKTTPKAWLDIQPFDLDPQQNFSHTENEQYSLAAMSRGKYQSAFANQSAPPTKDGFEDPDAPKDRVTLNESKEEASIVLVADGDFLEDKTLQRFPDNLTFFLNVVDLVTLDQDLINIRAKNLTDRPIAPLSESQKLMIRGINMIGIPALVVVVGISRMFLRKRRRVYQHVN